MLEGLDLMLFEECAENLEQALAASANDRIEGKRLSKRSQNAITKSERYPCFWCLDF